MLFYIFEAFENFDKQCTSCAQCEITTKIQTDQTWWFLNGGGHTVDECVEACHKNSHCFFASYSNDGHCNMTKTCHSTQGSGFTRFKKLSEQGLNIASIS